MKPKDFERILEAVEHSPKSGIGLYSLHLKTNIPLEVLRDSLDSHPEYFTQIPDKKTFTLNMHGGFSGDIEIMLNDYIETRRKGNGTIIMLVASALLILAMTGWIQSHA